jgi:hypothetical protein
MSAAEGLEIRAIVSPYGPVRNDAREASRSNSSQAVLGKANRT